MALPVPPPARGWLQQRGLQQGRGVHVVLRLLCLELVLEVFKKYIAKGNGELQSEGTAPGPASREADPLPRRSASEHVWWVTARRELLVWKKKK